MKLLVLDNYDSFTYNLVHLVNELGFGNGLKVVRNDRLTVKDAEEFDSILLSPGPGVPSDAGIMPELLKTYSSSKKILGVCLGHQAIAENFGAQLYNMPEVFHGVSTSISVSSQEGLFRNIPGNLKVCRYHSWAVKPESLPNELQVTATDENGIVMAISHRKYNVKGVQFHPESIMTEHGKTIMMNWLSE
jgi:anthranilate synthase component II